MDSMEALIARLEAADEKTQRRVIFDALVYLHKNEFITDGPYDRAMELCDIGAFLNAALILVPEWELGKWRYILSHPGYDSGKLVADSRAEIHSPLSSGGGPKWIAFAATPALALCIAALKACQTAPVSPEDARQRLPVAGDAP